MKRQPAPAGRSIAALRDPLVPLDFGTWFRRTIEVFRRGFARLAVLALPLVLLTSLQTIILGFVKLSPAELHQRIVAAAAASPGGMIDHWAAWGIEFRPVLPVAAVFSVLILVASSFFQGSAYHLALRQANGQPITAVDALRAATPQVPRFIGTVLLFWLLVSVAIAILVLPGVLLDTGPAAFGGAAIAAVLSIVVFALSFASIFGVVFVERSGLKRCVQLLKGRFWATLGRMVVTAVIYLVYGLVLNALVKLLLLPFGGEQALPAAARVVVHLVNSVLTIPMLLFLLAPTLVSYAELRFWENSSTSTRTLVSELDR